MQKQTSYLGIGCVALLVGALAVTNQSLWIDEGAAALKAMEPTLPAWWHNLRAEGNSNLQLLGELFYLWTWAKLFGSSEIALRASNIPFFAGGALALAWGFSRHRRMQFAVTIVAGTNAFLWYYLSEARPYIVLFAFAAVVAAALFRLLENEDEASTSGIWFGFFCTGIIGLCATSLIAVPWAMGAMGAVVFWCGLRASFRMAWRFTGWSIFLFVSLGLLAGYYLWTLGLGARASDVGRTGLINIAYIFYELLGLAGLGPGRLNLRAAGAGQATAFLPGLACGAVSLFVLLLAGSASFRAQINRRRVVFFAIAVGLPFALVLAAGASAHMRLVGRHLAPLLPYPLALVAAGVGRLLFQPRLWQRLLAFGAVGVLLVSALEIRFAPRHRRDDYRSAASLAHKALASGEKVWWLADLSTGFYYHLPLGSGQITSSPPQGDNFSPPDLVILSKPDIYDSSGQIRAYLTRHDFKVTKELPAFAIYRPGSPAPLRSQGKSGE